MQDQCAMARAGINLNAASEEELATLDAIGPARAQRIVEFRRQNGRFVSARELRYIEGFAPTMVDELARLLWV